MLEIRYDNVIRDVFNQTADGKTAYVKIDLKSNFQKKSQVLNKAS